MSIKLIQRASVPTHITQRSTTQSERAFEGPDSSSGNSSSSLGFFRTDRLPAHPNKRQRKLLGWSCPPHRRKENPSWKAIRSRAIMGLWTPQKKVTFTSKSWKAVSQPSNDVIEGDFRMVIEGDFLSFLATPSAWHSNSPLRGNIWRFMELRPSLPIS